MVVVSRMVGIRVNKIGTIQWNIGTGIGSFFTVMDCYPFRFPVLFVSISALIYLFLMSFFKGSFYLYIFKISTL